jgi:tRNA dimethylallyltransferase
VITGPTGSGKTGIALRLAGKYPLEVISADSMQVYRHMDIATAKPTPEELSVLPHHLIDMVSPDEEFNAGMFVSLARQKISEVRARRAIPVVVGGTGLYIKALIYGLASAPPRSDRVRAHLKAIADEKGSPHLWSLLHRLDPGTARNLGENDRVRIVRALEIMILTGRRPGEIYQEHGFSRPYYEARIVCIVPDRDRLYGNIDSRVVKMVENGLVEETKRLLALGYGPGLRSMQTLAYKHIVDHLESRIGLDLAVSLIQRDTRRYAKRQLTWMRSHYDPGSFHAPEEAFPVIGDMLRDEVPSPEKG